MMRIFFVDDSGQRGKGGSDRYFVFGGFGIDGSQLHRLKDLQQEIFGMAPGMGERGDELKFSLIGQHKHSVKIWNPFAREGVEISTRISMIQHAIEELGNIPSVEAIIAVVDKHNASGSSPIEHAFRVLLERIEMSSAKFKQNTLIFCDEEQSVKGQLRKIHSENASTYIRFESIVETISFVPSNLSCGVQFADLIAGATSRMLNHQDQKYFEKLIPYIRKNAEGKWRTFGLALFPSKPDTWNEFNKNIINL